jgi:transposase
MATKKLTKEDILKIPELVKLYDTETIAYGFKVCPETIRRWARELRKRGYDVPKRPRKSILD